MPSEATIAALCDPGGRRSAAAIARRRNERHRRVANGARTADRNLPAGVARSLLLPRIHFEVQQIVLTRQAPYLVPPLVRLRRDILLDGRASLVCDHRLVERQMLRRSGMRCKGCIQLLSESAHMRQWVALSSVLVRCYYSEEAEELLEAVTREERSDERMAECAAPVEFGARQTVDAHEEMRAQEGIQLFSSGGSPVMRRCCIGVLRELLHQCRRQEALQQPERRVLSRGRLSLVSKARQRHIDGVQVVRPLRLLLCGCGSLLLFFLLAAAALCLCIPFCTALLLVAVPAVLQRQAQRGSHIALLECREGHCSLLLCERQRLLRCSCGAAACRCCISHSAGHSSRGNCASASACARKPATRSALLLLCAQRV